MSRVALVTFASSDYRNSLDRLSVQANNMGIFDVVIASDENDLDIHFRNKFRNRLVIGTRGYGYWCWKPQVVLQAFSQLNIGDAIVYVDAGCHLNRGGLHRMSYYLDMLTEETPILAFKNIPPVFPLVYDGRTIPNWPNEDWTKEDLFHFFKINKKSHIRKEQTFYATAFIMLKTEQTKQFLHDWINTFSSDWHLIDDTPSYRPDCATFIEHRHDQAIFSILCYKYPVHIISSLELVYPNRTGKRSNWASLDFSPIHAKRDLDPGLIRKLQLKIKRLGKSLGKRFNRIHDRFCS